MRHRLQSDDSVLRGVQVVELGEAEGHDFQIGREFLEQVVKMGNKLGAVKVRTNHPEGHGDVLSIVGEASNFTLDGDCVRADVKMFDVPTKDTLLALARQAGHLFGMSLDFAGETVKKAGTKLKQMTCEKIFAVDFVDTPAATRSLFSAGENKNQWRVVCSFSKPQVDTPQLTEEQNMTKQTLSLIYKKFGIDAEDKDAEKNLEAKLAEDPKPHDEPDGDEGYEKIMTMLSGFEKRLAAVEGKDGKKEELAEDEPPAKEYEDIEKKEEAMATMAAKVCSIMLSKVGVQPKGSRPAVADAGGEKGSELSTEEVKLCAGLKMNETERKQFAANLARAKQVKF